MKNRSTKLVARKAVESLCILLSKFSICSKTRKSPVHFSLLFLLAILSSPVSVIQASDGSLQSNKSQLLEETSTISLAHEIVFIDSAVEDQSLLIKAVRSDAEVILLSPDVDGVSQIAQSLRDRSDVSAIHIVSHGHAGQLLLGSSNLNSNTLRSYFSEINTISAALSKDADILLYGCNVAQGENGKAFISKFAEMTSADVAASENVTGDVEKGGDWVLENRQGKVQAGVVFSQKGLAGYKRLLATPVITSTEVTSVFEDADYSYTITATDAEHTLTYGAPTIPDWLSFDLDTQELTGSPTNAEVGNYSVVLEVTDGIVTVSQPFSIEVINTNDSPGGSVTIDGGLSATEGTKLTANTSTITDDDGLGTFSYAWKRGSTTVGTAKDYTPVQADVGSTLKVTVSYDDDDGFSESLTSSSTSSVIDTNNSPGGSVTITGGTSATEGTKLTANTSTITDADGLGSFSYAWKRGSTTVGTAKDYTPVQADVGFTLKVTVSYDDDDGFSESLTSSSTSSVIDTNNSPGGSVTITGGTSATEGTKLTANTSTITDADGLGSFSYAWKRGSTTVGTAKDYTPVQADVGFTLKVTVSYDDDDGFSESLTSSSTSSVTNTNDDPGGSVTITGGASATEGTKLTANTSTITDEDGLGSFSYEWRRFTTPVDSTRVGTAEEYTPVQADVGNTLKVTVSYRDEGGKTESLTSSSTSSVTNTNDDPGGSVTITGGASATEGTKLTANTSTITDEDGLGSFSYEWRRFTTPVDSTRVGTAEEYTPVQADVGNTLKVTVSYRDEGGKAESLTSAQSSTVTNTNDDPGGSVTITGGTSATEGTKLTANTSKITDEDGIDEGTFSYVWKRFITPGDTPTVGTSKDYTPVQADVGSTLIVTVTYQDGGGMAESLTSAQTSTVTNTNNKPEGIPTITGNVSKRGVLTADASPIKDEDGIAAGAFNYQWQRGESNTPDATSFTYTNILGATSVTYTLVQKDVNTKIKVVVTYVDNGGKTEVVPSSATGLVSNNNATPEGKPVITGIVKENEILSVDTSGITDLDGGVGGFTYQWTSGDDVIDGAVLVNYTLVQADVGNAIKVAVTYVDNGDTTETVTSDATVAVVNVNDSPTGKPIIIGEAIEGVGLTVDISAIDDVDGLGEFSYQWLRSGTNAIGEPTALEVGIGISYTLVQADVAARISLVVSFTDDQGQPESVTSLPTLPVVNVNDPPVGLPIIIGNPIPVQGDVLTVDTLSITDVDGLGVFSYQWLRDGLAIPDAIGPSHTLTQDEVDTFISVVVSYTDGQLTPESVESETLVGPVGNINDVGIVIIDSTPVSGLAISGETLSVISLIDIDGTTNATNTNSFEYQWLRNDVVIPDATGDSYDIPESADLRAIISLRVTYTDDFGANEVIFSNGIGPIFPDVPIVSPPDPVGPVVSTGWFTFVEIEKTSQATATDGFDDGGVLIPFSDSNGQFRPGVTGVIWSAIDSADNVGTAIQDVKVIPLVDINKGQISVEGASGGQVKVALNGNAINYPVTVPYTVTGSATTSDNSLSGGSVIINEPAAGGLPEEFINFVINGTEAVVITLGAPSNAVLGLVKTHTIQIFEGNVAPLVSISASQSGVGRMLKVDPNGGQVVVSADATDVNGNSLVYDWSDTDASIVNMDVDSDETTFTFNPGDVTSGFHHFHVSVSDGNASVNATLTLEVLEETPMLTTKDSDGDGIADYFDSISASHILQQKQSISNAFLIQTEPGLKLSLGETAFRANNSQSMVTSQDVVDYAFNGVTGIELLDEIENIGGYFDFIVDGLPIAGQSVQIVLPQLAPLPKLPVYRKLTPSGWQDFVEDEKNAIHSAAGSEGYCPPPGDAAYQPGLSEGRLCVQLTIEDGGPNDLDGLVNNSVTDPGGVSRFLASVSVKSSGGGGGATNPLLLLSVFFMLLYYRNGKHLVRKAA